MSKGWGRRVVSEVGGIFIEERRVLAQTWRWVDRLREGSKMREAAEWRWAVRRRC